MIRQVSDITVVDAHGAFTTAEFISSELARVGSQPGAIGISMIKMKWSNELIYDAAVGLSPVGPMLGSTNLVAIPCPPVCGGQGQ